LFPLSLLILGAMLIRTKSLPLWAGLLICVAAIAFPVSRIPRISLVAHVADVLMLVPLAYAGLGLLKSRGQIVRPASPHTRGPFVAVGTTVTRRPPHRTVRAGLLHTAPTLDVWRQSARSDADAGYGRWEASI
jgi:hypothetical protein